MSSEKHGLGQRHGGRGNRALQRKPSSLPAPHSPQQKLRQRKVWALQNLWRGSPAKREARGSGLCPAANNLLKAHCAMRETGLLLQESNVLTVQDAERLLQGLDLHLAASHAILVTDAGVHAARLELVIVRQSRVKLLLCALEVGLLRRQSTLLVDLLRRLVLNILRVLRTVHRRLARELVERILRLCLSRLSVGLEASEVRRNHLEHPEHAAVLRLHALVRS